MYHPKYYLGDRVKNKKYDIDEAIIVGIEVVESNPKYKTIYGSVDNYIDKSDTAQYCLVFYDDDVKDVVKEWYYEEHIELV
jgi:hypothetical protein